MATFLQLAKDLARESGTFSASALTTVVGQTGRAEKLVSWVVKAWTNIQNSRDAWFWMLADFTGSVLDGQARYTATELLGAGPAARWARWDEDEVIGAFSIWDPATGVSDESELRQITYDEWFYKYARGSHDENRPTEWAIAPDGDFVVGSTPDKTYTIRGSYRKSPQILAADNDVPEMPSRFHDMIVWEALRLSMISDGHYQESSWPAQDYIRARSKLERDQLPEITIP